MRSIISCVFLEIPIRRDGSQSYGDFAVATTMLTIHRYENFLGMADLSLRSVFRACQGLSRTKMAPSNSEKDPGTNFCRPEPNGRRDAGFEIM